MEFQVVSPFKFFHQNTVRVSTSLLLRIRAKHPAHLILLDSEAGHRGNSIESARVKPLFLDGTAHSIVIM